MESYFKEGTRFLEDIRTRYELWEVAGVMEFVQEAGEIVFVPSGWYHQVHNLEDSISINHNVINAYNIDVLLKSTEERLLDVKRELCDVEKLGVFTPREFQEQCQNLLLADFRMNSFNLIDLVDLVIKSRSSSVACQRPSSSWSCSDHLKNVFECKSNSQCLQHIRHYLMSHCSCIGGESTLCTHCLRFVNSTVLGGLACSHNFGCEACPELPKSPVILVNCRKMAHCGKIVINYENTKGLKDCIERQ